MTFGHFIWHSVRVRRGPNRYRARGSGCGEEAGQEAGGHAGYDLGDLAMRTTRKRRKRRRGVYTSNLETVSTRDPYLAGWGNTKISQESSILK